MPHKHTRREKNLATFDLPPSQVAKPLPVDTLSQKNKKTKTTKTQGETTQTGKKNKKRKRGDSNRDEAPRAFRRLMAFAGGKRPRSGLDDPVAPAKKAKTAPSTAENEREHATGIPAIRPGERLSEYGHRVDAALPLSGLVSKTVKNGKDPLGLKVRRTKKEMKMHKLYDEWRAQDKKIKEAREEDLEAAEEQEMEDDAAGVSWKMNLEDETSGGKPKTGKRTKYLGEARDREADPWAEIKRKRGEAPIGLHDVAQAPPELKAPQKKLLVRGAAVAVDGIPKAAGSLRKREELQGIRDEVVASYRKMVNKKRPAL